MEQKKRIVLTFPHKLVDQPIIYRLIKDYDLMVNILRARVTPREEGRLVMELTGAKSAIKQGMKYLDDLGVQVEEVVQDIQWHENRCTSCTACISSCPTNALWVDRKSMKVSFDKEKCILCELCITVCPYRAIEIQF